MKQQHNNTSFRLNIAIWCVLLVGLLMALILKMESGGGGVNHTQRFLIFKANGGLGHMLGQLSKCLHQALVTKRILIIDTVNHSAFQVPFDDIFFLKNITYYTNYDVISHVKTVNSIKMDVIKSQGVICKKGKDVARLEDVNWQGGCIYFLDEKNVNKLVDESQPVIMRADGCQGNRDLIWKFIGIQPSVLSYIISKKISHPYIGVHYRNTDMKHDIHPIFDKITKIIVTGHRDPIHIIYVATDDFSSIVRFQRQFPTYTVRYNTTLEPLHDVKKHNLHYLDSNDLQGLTKKELLRETLTDLYLLTQSTFFIGSEKSSFTRMVTIARKTPHDNIFTRVR